MSASRVLILFCWKNVMSGVSVRVSRLENSTSAAIMAAGRSVVMYVIEGLPEQVSLTVGNGCVTQLLLYICTKVIENIHFEIRTDKQKGLLFHARMCNNKCNIVKNGNAT